MIDKNANSIGDPAVKMKVGLELRVHRFPKSDATAQTYNNFVNDYINWRKKIVKSAETISLCNGHTLYFTSFSTKIEQLGTSSAYNDNNMYIIVHVPTW